ESLDDSRVARQTRRGSQRDLAADLGVGGRCFNVRRGGSADIRPGTDGGTARRTRGSHPLVQPVRPAACLASNDAASRGGRLVVLPPLLYGTAARGRFPEAGRESL